MKRSIILIMDGFGCGELPDAELYNDVGSNTLLHISKQIGEMNLPNLEKLGLGKLCDISGLQSNIDTFSAFGKMNEKSPGKDSVTGHWEISGIELDHAFPVYPNGFPDSIINEFERLTGYKTFGNIPASGTQIIKELGEEHLRTGKLIIYTSADSVFQIAAHESILSIDELYRCCDIARKLLDGEHKVGRVIARPFVGENAASFIRTKYRKDYSVIPPEDTIFDILLKNNIDTVGVGKIDDLFGGKGIKHKIHSKGNRECIEATIKAINDFPESMIMTNLVDFDMLYGHQRDTKGYYEELKLFDEELGNLLDSLKDDDLLIITSDHGNDPTFHGTDHTREYVPLLIYHNKINKNINLGTRASFADVGKTLADFFELNGDQLKGQSFYKEIY